jgi:hypothetical protein
MDASISAALERIGHSLSDATEDVLTEPLPPSIGAFLSPDQRPHVLCALVHALTDASNFQLIEQGDELFIKPRPEP